MDIVLEGSILLEALLSNSQAEIMYQFSTQIALLLGETYDDRARIYELVKLFYGLRSKIVHEGGGKEYQKILDKLKRKVGNVRNFINLLIRAIIFQFFTKNETYITFMSKKEIEVFLQRQIFIQNPPSISYDVINNMKQEFLISYIRNTIT